MALTAVKPPTEVHFAVPGNLSTPTGGYAYARHVLRLLPDFGITPHLVSLPAGYPFPDDADIEDTRRRLANVPDGAVLMLDGLAFGAMPETLVARIRQPIVALVHHPLGYEAGLAPSVARRLMALERQALGHADAIITTSETTRRLLVAEFAVNDAIVSVAEPGTLPAVRAHGTGHPLEILSVGAVSERKGYDVLIAALAAFAGSDWHLTIAGATDRNAAAVTTLRQAIMAAGLRAQVTLAGAVTEPELARLYSRADLFVMSSRYEGYGMVLAEAMARGLPLVATTGGAAAETVPEGAALKVPPDDAAALSEAIGRVLVSPGLRRRLADASWLAGQELPRWETTVRRIAGVIEAVARCRDEAPRGEKRA
ncbi:MAG: glycosyltransferase family 4 protein [Hyphomicrobiaceae bacterium]